MNALRSIFPGGLLLLMVTTANGYQVVNRIDQSELRDRRGNLTREASIIHVMNCTSPGESGGQFYIYQYTKRAAFRAIKPPQWGTALGGHDFVTFDQAVQQACYGRTTPPPGPCTPQNCAGVCLLGVCSGSPR